MGRGRETQRERGRGGEGIGRLKQGDKTYYTVRFFIKNI